MVNEKVTFTPQRGSIVTKTEAKIKIVQELTMVMFELTPEHAIYMKDAPEIHVEFPQEVKIETLQCKIEDVSMTGSTQRIEKECYRFEQTFLIKSFLAEDYIPAAIGESPKKIYFTVGDVRNPTAV